MESTAQGIYGFVHGLIPVGSVQAETQVGADGVDLAGSSSLSLGTQNPLFWLLILFLIFTGWIFGGFDFGVKRIGNVKVKAGR